jgi:hypothetical protein
LNVRFDLNPSPELRRGIDRWRAQQEGVPAAAPAARRLLEWALAHYYDAALSPQYTVDTPITLTTSDTDDAPVAAHAPDTRNAAETPDMDDAPDAPATHDTQIERDTPEPQPVTSWMDDSEPARRRRNVVEEKGAEIVRLRTAGRTWAAIGAELDVSQATIARALRAASGG